MSGPPLVKKDQPSPKKFLPLNIQIIVEQIWLSKLEVYALCLFGNGFELLESGGFWETFMKRACKWFEGWNLGFFVGKSKGKLECGVAQPQLVYNLLLKKRKPKIYLAEPSWLFWLKFDWQLQNLCSIYHFFCVRNLICPFCQKFSKCILSIEKIQKIALKIILGDDYSSYYMSCLEFGLDLHSTPLYKLCNQTVQKWQVWPILCT